MEAMGRVEPQRGLGAAGSVTTSKMNRVFAEVAPQISPQSQIRDLPKSRRLAHMTRSLHLTICMAIWPGVVVEPIATQHNEELQAE
ncbi:hypothetical protein BDBG_16666 [Blastomyces gilchristii SLH14081]|uniref:Uncharacterized protein n=1 Tax=Blastomyces gilchristii (strain SLH14081) TaxID=559298 RepID=A0A179UI36_BLAGS|nr:uncharacterized protein BDBG_16666 [Blastomyces gilchristii SLH14081]OAT06691.1 hypothetical protein BDBG_16666 [Blastomyces gilchristii SLH14081]